MVRDRVFVCVMSGLRMAVLPNFQVFLSYMQYVCVAALPFCNGIF